MPHKWPSIPLKKNNMHVAFRRGLPIVLYYSITYKRYVWFVLATQPLPSSLTIYWILRTNSYFVRIEQSIKKNKALSKSPLGNGIWKRVLNFYHADICEIQCSYIDMSRWNPNSPEKLVSRLIYFAVGAHAWIRAQYQGAYIEAI